MGHYEFISEELTELFGLPQEVFEIDLESRHPLSKDGDVEYFDKQTLRIGLRSISYKYKRNQKEGWEGVDINYPTSGSRFLIDSLESRLIKVKGASTILRSGRLEFHSISLTTLILSDSADGLLIDLVRFS